MGAVGQHIVETPVKYVLRPYQNEAVSSIFEWFGNNQGNPVIALPTGTGKSLVIADFVKRVLTTWPGQRLIMLTHVKELVEQNCEKLLTLWPDAPVGIYSAGLKRKEADASIVFGNVQSVARLLKRDPEGLGVRHLIIIDEAHLLSPKNTSQYQRVLTKLKILNPQVKVIGLTATPYRMKSGLITDGDGLFDGTCYDLCSMANFNKLMDDGYICPLIPKKPTLTLDLSRVKITAGEYNKKSLQETVDTDEITRQAIEETVRYGQDRKSWLVFASGIQNAENICGMLQSCGIEAAVCHSKLSDQENTDRINAFKSGELRALVNNNKLTTGFDHPGIDLIVMLRPTMSVGLWVQMLGRGTRPNPGKTDCLVLDFAGNTARLGPINDPVIPVRRGKRKGPTGDAPVKICDECDMYCHTSARVCPCCGVEFPTVSKLSKTASQHELIKTFKPPQVDTLEVDRVTYEIYHKRNSTGQPTMKVTYHCGFTEKFCEWLCFSHTGFARRKAEAWWKNRSTISGIPPNVEEAVKHSAEFLKMPKTITVSLEHGSKYHKITKATF